MVNVTGGYVDGQSECCFSQEELSGETQLSRAENEVKWRPCRRWLYLGRKTNTGIIPKWGDGGNTQETSLARACPVHLCRL